MKEWPKSKHNRRWRRMLDRPSWVQYARNPSSGVSPVFVALRAYDVQVAMQRYIYKHVMTSISLDIVKAMGVPPDLIGEIRCSLPPT